MLRSSRIGPVALTLAALCLLPVQARAENKEHSIELGATFTFVKFDPQSVLDDKTTESFIGGFNFSKRHGAEIEFTHTGTATPRRGEFFDTSVDIWRFGYTYNAYPKPKVVSFFRLGAGLWNSKPDDHLGGPTPLQDSHNDFFVYAGGGVRFFVNDLIAIRLAGSVDLIAATNTILNSDTQATGELGVVFVFGGHEPTPKSDQPAPAAPKPDEKKPEEKKPEEKKPSDDVKPPTS